MGVDAGETAGLATDGIANKRHPREAPQPGPSDVDEAYWYFGFRKAAEEPPHSE
jgi:hypothetical protein